MQTEKTLDKIISLPSVCDHGLLRMETKGTPQRPAETEEGLLLQKKLGKFKSSKVHSFGITS